MKFEDRIEALIWKALMNSYNNGIGKALQESNYLKYIWATSTLENKCKVCKSLNGIELSVNEINEIFPAHPSCHCFLLPKVN